MIGYYIHHHGFGHLARAMSVCARMRRPVTAMTSLDVPEPQPFSAVMRLPCDDEGPRPREATAHGALHWAPHHDAGLSARMNQIAEWVSDARPEAVVVDVSVEVALFIRLLGVPVIVVALPGTRVDARMCWCIASPITSWRPGRARCVCRHGCGNGRTRPATSVASAASRAVTVAATSPSHRHGR